MAIAIAAGLESMAEFDTACVRLVAELTRVEEWLRLPDFHAPSRGRPE
jgi:hypothetical protein